MNNISQTGILVQSLTAVMWGNTVIRSPINFAAVINKVSGDIFNGKPQILDIPDDAPPDIPFIILKSKDNRHFFQVSKNRIDIILQETHEKGMLLYDESSKLMDTLLIKLLPEIEATIQVFENLAYVGRYIIETPSSVKYLYDKYLKENERLKNSHIIELNCLHHSQIASFKTNEWLRLHSARRLEDDYDGAIGIEVDINTMNMNTSNCTGSQVVDFYDDINSYIDKIIDTYLE
jgi:hypothetical protein